MAEARIQDRWTHTSELMAAIYNTVRDTKKRQKPFVGAEFNPFGRPPEPQVVPTTIDAFKFFVDGTIPPEVTHASG